MKKIILSLIIILFGSGIVFGAYKYFQPNKNYAQIPEPFSEPQIQEPTFPDNTCDITQYGAVGDGNTSNTQAFAKAIADCEQKGGGKILVPAGKWFTGPINLDNNIDLHLEKDAEIIFSDKYQDYLPVVFTRFEGIELYNYSPLIYTKDKENIAITGEGTLNGQGEKWWSWKKSEQGAVDRLYKMAQDNVPVEQRVFGTRDDALRPSFLQFINCKNIFLKDFTIKDGPMWTIHPVYSENILVKNVSINTNGNNNDGIVVDSSRNVLIDSCNISANDDAISIKSGLDDEGQRINRPSENIVIKNCQITRGHSGLALGSEMSGGINNVLMKNCSIAGVDQGIRLKSAPGRGSVVQNVWVQDVDMGELTNNAIQFDMGYDDTSYSEDSKDNPIFRQIYFEDISCKKTDYAVEMKGISSKTIDNVIISDLTATTKKGIRISRAQNILLDDIDVTSEKTPLFRFNRSKNITLGKVPCKKIDSKCIMLELMENKEINK